MTSNASISISVPRSDAFSRRNHLDSPSGKNKCREVNTATPLIFLPYLKSLKEIKCAQNQFLISIRTKSII